MTKAAPSYLQCSDPLPSCYRRHFAQTQSCRDGTRSQKVQTWMQISVISIALEQLSSHSVIAVWRLEVALSGIICSV